MSIFFPLGVALFQVQVRDSCSASPLSLSPCDTSMLINLRLLLEYAIAQHQLLAEAADVSAPAAFEAVGPGLQAHGVPLEIGSDELGEEDICRHRRGRSRAVHHVLHDLHDVQKVQPLWHRLNRGYPCTVSNWMGMVSIPVTSTPPYHLPWHPSNASSMHQVPLHLVAIRVDLPLWTVCALSDPEDSRHPSLGSSDHARHRRQVSDRCSSCTPTTLGRRADMSPSLVSLVRCSGLRLPTRPLSTV